MPTDDPRAKHPDEVMFIQSGDLPSNRAPAVLSRAYCKGWKDAISNVIEHLNGQMGVWRDGDIALEHLLKHIQQNVSSLQIEPPPSLFEALDEGGVRNARRWVFYASSPQTALMLGTKLDPNDNSVDWVKECNRLANAAMRQSAPDGK